jgi:hypothetical protein
VASLPTRIGLAAGAGIVALIVLGTTTWFLGDALMLLLEAKGFAPAAAAGLTGLAGLVLVALIGVWAKWLVGSHRRATRPATATASSPAAGTVNGLAAELGAVIGQQLVTTTKTHPYKTMGAALAAGLAVGAIPELRKTLTDLLKR